MAASPSIMSQLFQRSNALSGSSSSNSSSSPGPLPKIVVFSIDMDGALLSAQYSKALNAAIVTLRAELLTKKGKTLSPATKEALEKVCIRSPFEADYETQPKEVKELLAKATKIALEQAHVALIEHILANIPNNATVYLLSGSNRQTRYRDILNGYPNKNGCSAIPLQQLATIIQERLKHHKVKANVNLDGMLLEDLVTKEPLGTHFNSMLKRGAAPRFKGEDTETIDKNTEFDENKRMLLYTQMQHIALKHQEHHVAFHFYDDNPYTETNKQIISAIQLFFNSQAPDALLTFLEKQIPVALLPYVSASTRESLEQIREAIHAWSHNSPTAIVDVYKALSLFQQEQPKVIEQLYVFLETFKRKQPRTTAPLTTTTVTAESEQIDVIKQISKTLEASQNIMSDAIPKNVTLHLHEYADATQDRASAYVTLAPMTSESTPTTSVEASGFIFDVPATFKHVTPIQGLGELDPNYKENYRSASLKLRHKDFFNCTDIKKKEHIFQRQMNPWIQKTNDASQSLTPPSKRGSFFKRSPTSVKSASAKLGAFTR